MSHVDDGTLHAYLDGELSPAEVQGVDAHLAQCPACRGRLDEERALITRAGELLALAAPPDRELPPFRAGDVKPSPRLWSKVRLPLAWAATVLLALGIGTYMGRGHEQALQPQKASSDAQPAERRALDAPVSERARRESLSWVRREASALPAAQPPVPAQGALTKADRMERKRGAQVAVPTESASAQSAATPAPAPAPAPQAGIVALDGELYSPLGASISTDSARRLLGRDPLVVPRAPIRRIYPAREAGYSAVVIVEQALDSGRVIAVVNRRVSPVAVDRVVVTAAPMARADTMSATDHAGVDERVTDSLAAAPAAKAAARLGYAEKRKQETPNRLVRRLGDLEIQISGPLSSDSLQKLLQLVQPMKP